MKNFSFKKVLAVTLAAATALTFAPVSTLGLTGVVEAQAATTVKAGDELAVTLKSVKTSASTADSAEYYLAVPDGVKGDQNVTIATSDAAVANVAVGAKATVLGTMSQTVTWDDLHTAEGIIKVTAKKGIVDTADKTAKITVSYTDANKFTQTITLNVTVTPLSPKAQNIKYDGTNTVADKGNVTLHLGTTLNTLALGNNGDDNPVALADSDAVTSDDSTVVDCTGNTLALKKVGKATITVKDKVTPTANTYTFTVNVVADSTFTITDATGTAKTIADAATYTVGSPLKTITLTKSNPSAAIGAVLSGALDGEKIKYEELDSAGIAATNQITVSGDTVTAKDTATADNYFVKVSVGNKAAFVKVVVSTKDYASLSTTADGTKVEAAATNATPTAVATGSLTLSTSNKKSANLAIKSNDTDNAFTVESTNPSVATAEKSGNNVVITAKAAGTTTVTIKNDGNSDLTGTATITLTVKVQTADVQNNNASSDVFGGVVTELKVTDNHEYNLLNSDAKFRSNGNWYTASQLTWSLQQSPNVTPGNMTLTSYAGAITASGAGQLKVKTANAERFAEDVNGKYIVGVYTGGGTNILVYSEPITVTAPANAVETRTYSLGTKSKTSSEVGANAEVSKDLVDSVPFTGTNYKFLDASKGHVTPGTYHGRNFDLVVEAGSGTNGIAKGSKLVSKGVVEDGTYYEKFYVPYYDDTENPATKFVAELTVTVAVNSKSASIKVMDGDFQLDGSSENPDNSKVITLDLVSNKTYDLASHIVASKAGTTYKYDRTTEVVSVKDGIVTAEKAGTASVKITPNYNGVDGTPVYVYFRVNANPDADITVKGADGEEATPLTTREYFSKKFDSEKELAAAQVGYVQIELTGNETKDVTEKLSASTTGKGQFSFTLPKNIAGVTVDEKTGEITLDYDKVVKNFHYDDKLVFPVMVTTSEVTGSSALTYRYIYVVVDYTDVTINGLEKSYNVGTSVRATLPDSWLDLTPDGKRIISNGTVYRVTPLGKDDDLEDKNLYTDDDTTAFVFDGEHVRYATVSGKTMHVLVEAYSPDKKLGRTYRVVEIKSVQGKKNYVTKIESTDGKVLYDASTAANTGAAIALNIDQVTTVKVSVAYTPDASLNPKDDPAFTIDKAGTDGFTNNTVNVFVAATENPKTYEVTLTPSMKGTQVVTIYPTEDRLSTTDYSLVDYDHLNLAVKNIADESIVTNDNPAKVTGVKVKNKKGAKVTVTFNEDNTKETMRYYVQKKIGKKTSGKSVGSTKTTLSVAKGKTVKVRVKAYYYDESGKKHVGKYSSWKTLKTDKK